MFQGNCPQSIPNTAKLKDMADNKLNKIIKVLLIIILAMIALYPIAIIVLGMILYLNS